jgi:dienelactone hydrolase
MFNSAQTSATVMMWMPELPMPWTMKRPTPRGWLGFSRGGYLTFLALTEHPDIDVGVIMAPAPVNGLLDKALPNAPNVQGSTLIVVAANDLPEFNNEKQDHVATATSVNDALKAEGKDTELKILDAFEDNGHDLFQELRPEYWAHIEAYLADHL